MNTTEIKRENLINLYNAKGEQHGYWEVYFSNGQLGYKGNFVNGKLHGYLEQYYMNGQLRLKGNYVDGQQHGLWEEYHDNGQSYFKGNYDMGKEVKEVVELEKATNQTAVEWLVEKLQENGIPLLKDELEFIDQAKELEKEQIIEAYNKGNDAKEFSNSERYYNETYGSEK